VNAHGVHTACFHLVNCSVGFLFVSGRVIHPVPATLLVTLVPSCAHITCVQRIGLYLEHAAPTCCLAHLLGLGGVACALSGRLMRCSQGGPPQSKPPLPLLTRQPPLEAAGNHPPT
jgi:hypothetical protein